MSLATFEKLTPIIEIFVPLDKFVVVKFGFLLAYSYLCQKIAER